MATQVASSRPQLHPAFAFCMGQGGRVAASPLPWRPPWLPCVAGRARRARSDAARRSAMKAVLHKGAAPPAASMATGSPKGPKGPKPRGSPLHAAEGASSGAGAAPGAPAEEEEASDYTDADESISAPTEFLAEFLSAIMGKDYPTALKYCKLILQYEPNNRTAREFYPLIIEKLVQSTIDEARSDGEDDSSSGGSGSLAGSGSDDDEDSSGSSGDLSDEEDDDEDGGKQDREGRNDNSSVEFGDTDGTTASYSSLEDEEADPTDTCGAHMTLANDNEDIGNGNEPPVCEVVEELPLNNDQTEMLRCSDSESPTEPVSQKLITELRARVVPVAGGRQW